MSTRFSIKPMTPSRLWSLTAAAITCALLSACSPKTQTVEAAGDVAVRTEPGPISSLASAVPGLSPQQAAIGAGGLLALAKTKLPPDQYAQVVKAFPNSDVLIAEAVKAGAPSQPTSLSSLTPTFSQAGITPDQVNRLIPALGNEVSKRGGQNLANSLLSVLK